MHDSLNPLTGLLPMAAMWLNVIFGGVGAGLINMFIFILTAVFLSGMMVGRTPEYLARNEKVRADLVLPSGSGMDPHITLAAALFQAPRVAEARALPVERVRDLVHEQTDSTVLASFGDPVVNVLELNLALDALGASR